jgi:hypothetical protein
MKIELITAVAALIVSILGVLVNALQLGIQRRKLKDDRKQWERAVERGITQTIFQETSIKLYEARIREYASIFPLLKITARYEWKRLGGNQLVKDSHQDAVEAIQKMADDLTDVSYSNLGLLMSEESRVYLTGLRRCCGAFKKNKMTFEELAKQAHWFKHSLRADLHIPNNSIENEEFKKYAETINEFLQSDRN